MSVLRIDRLSARVAQRKVLHEVSAEIKAGEVVVLTGANASGKTTLMRVLAGLHPRSDGCIEFSASSAGRPPIGFAVEPSAFPKELSGAQAFELVAAALGSILYEDAQAYSAAVGLSAYLRDPIGSYSLGTSQKLAIALALIGKPKLLLLDESLNGLDLHSIGETLKFLHRQARVAQQSALLVTHNLDLAQPYTDRAWLLDDGRLVHEWSSEVLRQMEASHRLLSREVLDLCQ